MNRWIIIHLKFVFKKIWPIINSKGVLWFLSSVKIRKFSLTTYIVTYSYIFYFKEPSNKCLYTGTELDVWFCGFKNWKRCLNLILIMISFEQAMYIFANCNHLSTKIYKWKLKRIVLSYNTSKFLLWTVNKFKRKMRSRT